MNLHIGLLYKTKQIQANPHLRVNLIFNVWFIYGSGQEFAAYFSPTTLAIAYHHRIPFNNTQDYFIWTGNCIRVCIYLMLHKAFFNCDTLY